MAITVGYNPVGYLVPDAYVRNYYAPTNFTSDAVPFRYGRRNWGIIAVFPPTPPAPPPPPPPPP